MRGKVAIVAVLALGLTGSQAAAQEAEWARRLREIADKVGGALQPRAAGSAWGSNAAQLCAPGQGGMSHAQLVGVMALRIGIHSHSFDEVTVTASQSTDGADLVFRFQCQWKTAVLGRSQTTDFTARVRQAGVQGVQLLSDSSGRWNQRNSAMLTTFMTHALWGVLNGSSLDQRKRNALVQHQLALFQSGFGNITPYLSIPISGRDAQGNSVVMFCFFWETALVGANQITLVKWTVGSTAEVTTTKAASNSLDPYLRDVLGPAVR